ncbi:MAG: threonine synthase [Leptospiraceae bacterium]|nr:MAG: threonine synthase [Leptospiraceae bacterium]
MQANFKAQLECMDCKQEYDINEIIFRCPRCNGLLDVRHNLNALKTYTSEYWKHLFDNRFRMEYPFSSGVWGKKEWVLPELKNHNIVSLGEGATPLVPLPQYAKELKLNELWIKQCGISHTGSFKDLGMTVLVSHVKQLIELGKPIKAISCASTGDTSAALAAYASFANIPVIIFLPQNKISLAQLIQPISNGAIVLSLETDFDGCMEIVQEVTLDKESGIYLANSMNPLRIEGQKTVGIEVIQQLRWNKPDWFIIPGGNLGNVSALVEGFVLLKETGIINSIPKVAVAQSSKANPLYRSYLNKFQTFEPVKAQTTLASAIQIGNPVSYKRAKRALEISNGVVEEASEDELANMAAYIDKMGMFLDPHTAVAMVALKKLKDKNIIKNNESVVIISTAHGLKFTEFKVNYHKNQLNEVQAKFKNEPILLPPDIKKVKEVIKQKLQL